MLIIARTTDVQTVVMNGDSNTRVMSGHILTVQSNQFCAVQKAECAVQVAKLCSPKYVLWTFTPINNKSYSLICCICSGGRWELATCLSYTSGKGVLCQPIALLVYSGLPSFSGYRHSASQWRIIPSLVPLVQRPIQDFGCLALLRPVLPLW